MTITDSTDADTSTSTSSDSKDTADTPATKSVDIRNEQEGGLRRLMDWFDMPDFGRWFDRRPTLRGSLLDDNWIKVEEHVEGDHLTIKAEVPGIDPDKDADISISGGRLRLKVERRRSERSATEGGFHSEFRYGSLYRSVPVPEGVDPDQVKATYNDGILTVTMPLPPAAQTGGTKIAISR
ncbi:MAG: Hsp20/alpha crystallin family protein [Acidimicrobiales bacterium]